MQNATPHIVTRLNWFGIAYTSTVYLTREEARDRIVDGRLLTVAEGNARNMERLWESFKSMEKSEGGMDTTQWQEREETKLLIENEQV